MLVVSLAIGRLNLVRPIAPEALVIDQRGLNA